MKNLKLTGKRALSLILTFVLILSLPLCINAATVNTAETGKIVTGSCGANGSNVTYRLDTATGVLTISGTGKMSDYVYRYSSSSGSQINSPWFQYRKSIKSVVIENGITYIGSYTIGMLSALVDVQIPTSVTSIAALAIYDCASLTSISIPSSVTDITAYSITYCPALTEINVDSENQVYSSYDGALYSKQQDKLIRFPEGKNTLNGFPTTLTSVGGYAFRNCALLTTVEIPSGVTSIGEYAFYYCTSLTDVDIATSVTSIGKYAFAESGVTSVCIPYSVTTIEERTFANCKGLKSVKIPHCIKTINDLAFTGCTNLTEVEIPLEVESISNDAFWGCAKLKRAYIFNKNLTFGKEVFLSCPNVTIYGYSGSTAETYANSNKHTFEYINTVFKVESDGTTPDTFKDFDGPTTINTSDIAIQAVDKEVFLGIFSDRDHTITVGDTIELGYGLNTVYSAYKRVGTLNAEANDKTGSTAQTSGFDLYGAQFREKTNDWTAGLRFCTRVSKSLLSEIASKTGNDPEDVECGYLLCKKDSVPENTELTVGMTTKEGKTITEKAAPKKYFDGETYFVYTAVITDIPDSMQGTDIVARPFMKYLDANGIQRYYYFTENGASNCGGGYYTSYEAVMDKHTAAQGQ